ncbi:MAG: collagen-like protein [Clostridia bacterium]|nr:collagen-like protein [Clostridia bacterium]
MSKEKKFHNLIEQSGQEEKERVWSKIREKDIANKQNEPTRCETKPKKVGFFFTRKFAAWSGAIALALLFSAVGITQIFLKGQIERPGGNADLEAQPNYSDNQQEEIAPDVSVPEFGETSTDDFISDSGVQGESGDKGAVGESGPQGESGDYEESGPQGPSAGNYYTSADYTERELSQTLQEYAPDLLCFERLYEATCLTLIAESNTNQKLVYLKETYPAYELLGSVTLSVVPQDIIVVDLLGFETLSNKSVINGVTVYYEVLTVGNGIQIGDAYFRYNGYKYYVTVIEDSDEITLDGAYMLSLVQELLS